MRHIVLACAAVAALSACATRVAVPSGPVASQVPPAIHEQLLKIGRVVAPPQTAALYAPLQQREPYAGVKVARSERYGPDAERHLLDVFTPEPGGAARPVLVFVHGGAFVAGNRRTGDSPFYDNVMLWAVKNGMVGVNMTYRLAPANPWPAAQQDLASALNWVRQNIAARGGDPNRIVLMGHSAGAAHVAQYVGHPQFHVAPGGGIAGAVMLSGLFDTTTTEANPPLQAYFGKDASQYAARSALPGMKASKLPMLLAYAELDPEDFHRQAEQARREMCAGGASCPPLLKLMGESHMSEIYAVNTADTAFTAPLKAFVDGLR
jgi:triacylglycerol lipase